MYPRENFGVKVKPVHLPRNSKKTINETKNVVGNLELRVFGLSTEFITKGKLATVKRYEHSNLFTFNLNLLNLPLQLSNLLIN